MKEFLVNPLLTDLTVKYIWLKDVKEYRLHILPPYIGEDLTDWRNGIR